MNTYSALNSLNEYISHQHSETKTKLAELLQVDLKDLEKVLLASIGVVTISAAHGFKIGGLFGSPEIGAAIGAVVGIVIVIGTISYRIYINSKDRKIVRVEQITHS